MTHTKTTLTESELKDYLREHVGVKTGSFTTEPLTPLSEPQTVNYAIAADRKSVTLDIKQPKKRGRPKGSKNRPKETK